MQNDDIKLTSGAVILAAILLSTTDSKAENTLATPGFRLETGKKSVNASEYFNPNALKVNNDGRLSTDGLEYLN